MAQLTAAISFAKVNTAIGASHTDLGALCRDSNIKMWAKYKPVVWASIDTLAALNSGSITWNPNAASNLQWWKSSNGDYGLDYSNAQVNVGIGTSGVITALEAIAAKIDGGANGWGYTKPSGGSSSPYRLTDFLQYNHSIANPISSVTAANVAASLTSAYSISCEIRRAAMTNITQRDYLIPEDITQQTLNIGIAIFKKSGNTYSPIAWVFGETSWLGAGITYSDAADGIISQTDSVVVSRLKDGGTYYLLPVYATANLAQPPASAGTEDVHNCSAGAPNSSMKFITVPYATFASFTATRQSTTQTIGVPELSNRQISELWSYYTTFYVNSTYTGYNGGPIDVGQLVFAVVNENFNGTFAQGNYAYHWSNSSAVTIGSNEKKTIVTISPADAIALDSSHSWRVYTSITGEVMYFSLRTPSQT